jgi:putative CocE/NonD family hydrolase
VSGAELWKHADSLEAIGANPTTYYLGATSGGAGKGARAGRLTTARPASSPPDEWVYDPLDTRPGAEARGDGDDYVVRSGPVDLGSRGLVFATAPFSEPTEISGFPSVKLWLSLDVPDTDFRLTLEEVTREGKRILLTDTQLRGRYRESLREPKLIPAGVVLPFDFRQFRFMSRRLAAGSRVQLIVESPNAIGIQKNYNSGGAVVRETAKDARTAHIRLHHEPERWSVLTLPIVK